MAPVSTTIGIDLGTTNCCVAVLRTNGQVDIIDNDFGHRTTPSYVAFTENEEIIGKPAQERVFRTPENVVYDAKRFIGRRFDDTYLQQNIKLWPFKVIRDEEHDTPLIQISRNGQTRNYKPHEISAKLLAYMKEVAEKRLGESVTDAVITVPAYFNFHQRTATKEAGRLAGLNVLKIINEPTAAALAYVHKNEVTDCKNLLVMDVGGGTLDVSVVTVQGKSISVRATSGNTHLGGRDFDNNLVNLIVSKIKKLYNINVEERKVTMQRIKGLVAKLKTNLSFQTSTFFDLPSMDGRDIDLEITRYEFEKVNSQLLDSCIQTVENCLSNSDLKKTEISTILLVGGSSRIPKLQQMLKDAFNGKVNLSGTINPDEAVAYGAAVQAAITSKGNKLEVIEIEDVTPLSLGIAVNCGCMATVIRRNSKIPITKTCNLATSLNNQNEVHIHIYEGERPITEHNTLIGRCAFQLPKKPVGCPIYILFCIDVNGILKIEAKVDTGVYTTLTIKYEKQTVQKVSDILQDAAENKNTDYKALQYASNLTSLKNYCERIKSICYYKTKYINDKDKNTMSAIAIDISQWILNNGNKDGTTEEINNIEQKQKEIEDICEPILNIYGYEIKSMSEEEFYNFASQN